MNKNIQQLSNTIVEFYEKLSAWESSVIEGGEISVPQMHAIEILQIYGSMKMKELADKIGVTTGTLTVTVDRLEQKGIVERTPNPEDRRSFVISLTEAGIKKEKTHSQYHLNLVKECTDEFSEDDITILNDLLRKFVKNI